MIRLLGLCAEVEEKVGEIYALFAENPLCDKELAAIWQRMARDEADHAHQLRLALRLPLKITFAKIVDNCPNPEELLATANDILSEAKRKDFPVIEMLKRSVTLEKQFRRIHATYALLFNDPSLLRTFKRLAREDEQHIEALQKYIETFTTPKR